MYLNTIMKKNNLYVLAIAGAVAMSSCSKLGDLSADNFKVTPTPLEAIGGEVPATINGVFPEKYMKKKAVVTVTPVLKYEGGEAVGQSATFQGEKVEGNGTQIEYKVGGSYTMKTNFQYVPAMISSELYARFEAKLGKKTVSIPEVKIGYGVLSTSELLKKCVITASTAPDAYQRIIEQKQEANIKLGDEYAIVSMDHGMKVDTVVTEVLSLRGTLKSASVEAGKAILAKENGFEHTIVNKTVAANSAWIACDFDPESADVLGSIAIKVEGEIESGINEVLNKVAQSGKIYNAAGQLVGKGNINTVNSLPAGIYVVNGVKVIKK